LLIRGSIYKEEEQMSKIRGRVWKYGDNINTDIISPPRYMELSYEEMARHAMEGIDPGFSQKIAKGDILVAGSNFGSGSSRETAPIALKLAGVELIIAKFFARIFFRNAINIGLPVIECAEVEDIAEGDKLEVDLERGIIVNLTRGERYQGSVLPPHIMEIVNAGGFVPYLAKRLSQGEQVRES
jgi:3-isopropylmalate/(R)-2-methylmalate dehydratase small subunit